MPSDVKQLLEDIKTEYRETAHLTGRKHLSAEVAAALAAVPRHAFVPAGDIHRAYDNYPLPIGHRQTISQPYMVALMTDLLDLGPGCRVLEVGTGCGYQTAVLAQLAAQVYSVEIIEPLAQDAAARLAAQGYDNIHLRRGDGYRGWPEAAPFDAIMVTACAPAIPSPLVTQLAPGGRLVIPLQQGDEQWLVRGELDAEEKLTTTRLLPVRFVPLTRSD
ncbi:protein-L-isoaspartate(D-aspartate) O-methyltransferase [Exilibacterium tricleocarpae]|uniref:Protein-L-isoaspartate O-methyltransferase n=1 Tax=Exilibacterium tricleocarpae TaxID=2591008 RepID=A0A545STJ0_9GAMM|nr:protein-L-isoaspartate(D-aspartate) O-methyltransferase [Exilibacterium tricleocarpae]TQV68276.1 protein-L-isoaspartate(D-aspartate) O-methyltransferase [Exilibacterium tricleocarpae]